MMVSRKGAGRQRHLEVKYLWVQQACREEHYSIHKVAGEWNPADLLTKPLIGEAVGRWLRSLACDRVNRDAVVSASGAVGECWPCTTLIRRIRMTTTALYSLASVTVLVQCVHRSDTNSSHWVCLFFAHLTQVPDNATDDMAMLVKFDDDPK